MRVISDVREMRRFARSVRCDGRTLALVPTMGALHEGHTSLVSIAAMEADSVVVSIFVNPSQFGPREDFDRYPRDLESDAERLRKRGDVDAVFAPEIRDMYPRKPGDQKIQVVPRSLIEHLCGPFRPGHFEGVATVVTKLFNICDPDIAVFGRKDAQQFVILQRVVEDLGYGIRVVGGPTVRERDGLALSSRNSYLTPDERREATILYDALRAAEKLVRAGELDPGAIVRAMNEKISESSLASLQYAEVVDSQTLQPMARLEEGKEIIAALAVCFGKTRLIDNVFITVPTSSA